MTDNSVLIVEDDTSLAAMIAEFLEQNGFVARIENRGDVAVARIRTEQPSIVILDLMLPGRDGLDVCRDVRDVYHGHILMLTASGNEVDEVVGLEIGADDYLAKPVRPRILLARMRALLRRPISPSTAKGVRVCVGNLVVDTAIREARIRDTVLSLTSGEFDMLVFFAANAGEVLSRRLIYQELRGTQYDELDRSMDLMVSRLRKKLEISSGQQEIIKTVRGVGYLFATS